MIILIPITILSFVWLLYHPEFTILLIAFTNIIKGFLQEQIPIFEEIDLTVLLISILWLGLGKIALLGNWELPNWSRNILILFTIFCGVLAFSGFYSPSPQSGGLKIIRFLIFSSSMLFAPIIFLRNYNDSKRMLKYFKILSGVILCAMLLNLIIIAVSGGLVTYLVRASLLEANPIAVSRSLAVIAAMVTIIGIRKNGIKLFSSLILLSLILLAIVATGSRGPLASFFAGIILFTLLFESPPYRSRLLLVGFIAVAIVLGLLFLLPESLTTRFIQMTQGDIIVTADGVERISTIATRLNFWDISIKRWLDNGFSFLFGIGAGGFSSLFVWKDFRWYPHNIFIEVLLEQGILGLIIMLIMIIVSLKYLFQIKRLEIISEHSSVWIASMLVIFFSAQVSGDLNDNRALLMFLSVSLCSVRLDKIFHNKSHDFINA